MPQPTDEEILASPDFAQLAKNALLLSLAASWDDFAELAPLFNVKPKDVPQTAKAQDTLRAKRQARRQSLRHHGRRIGPSAAQLQGHGRQAPGVFDAAGLNTASRSPLKHRS
ncbi:MAG: hypothetical protein I8H71_11820 [Xanthomonadaceae bacterium]|nr:hypothetical protein [Xanthomonadaceae bacterium]